MRIATVLAAAAVATSMALPAQAAPAQTGMVKPVSVAPQIDSVDPGLGGPGDSIEITGRGFVENGSPATVTFLSVPGTVTSFTEALIVVEVPVIPNPPDGFIELRVATSLGSDIAPFRYYPGEPGSLSAPTALTGKAAKGLVRLRWGVPTSGADEITGYEYRFQLKGKKWSKWKKVAKGAKARQQVIKKIRPKRAYVFEVRAMAGTTEGPAASWELKKKK